MAVIITLVDNGVHDYISGREISYLKVYACLNKPKLDRMPMFYRGLTQETKVMSP